MTYEYIEPSSTFTSIAELKLANNYQALACDASGVQLEIEFLADVGWCIEARYDIADGNPYRQPFTGAQPLLRRSALTCTREDAQFKVTGVANEALVIDANGRLVLKSGETEYFATSVSPFARHAAPIEIYDYLISRKVTDFSLRSSLFTSAPTYSTRMVRFSYPRPEGLVLGLPGQTGEMNRNGYRFDLYNTDTFTHTPARPPMYQSWPILLHRTRDGRGWLAIFHDNPSRTFVDLGDFYPDSISFESKCNNTRVYIAHAATLGEVATKLATLLGSPPLPPLWAFGYQQCRWSYMSTKEIRDVAARMHREEFPCDAIYFDIDYMDGFRVFTHNTSEFADLAECVSELRERDVHSVCIVDPGVKIDPDYHAYAALKSSEAYLTTETGEPFEMRCWAEQSLLPDFGSPVAKQMWCKLQRDWLSTYAFSGVWNDMNEPSNFNNQNASTSLAFTARGPLTQEYNLYGYNMAATSAQGWRESHPERRGVVITRSGYPGVQQHAVIWHGDNCAWWEHMRLALETAVQYSLCGAYYTGPDLPGFTGNPSDDLAVRFFQLGAFLPLFRGHSRYFERDKEPYAFGAQAQSCIRDAIRLRYSLLREWYSGFELAISEKVSPLTPIFDGTGALIRDQFLLFNKFLIAPIIERDQRRRLVYLPTGTWYALGDTAQSLRGDSWHVVVVDLADMPIFVRAGSVIVRNQPQLTTAATLKARERYEVYPDEQGAASGYWYDDDGSSVKGEQRRLRLQYSSGQITTTPW